MRYGLISDIHGNLEALQAVLDLLLKERIDRYLCIGDVVGYGADPKACMRLIKKLEPAALVAGNHEWGTVELLGLEYFNEYAREAVIWTKRALSKDDADYLKSFRLVYEDEAMTLVHGTLDAPAEFHYLLNSHDAYLTMMQMKTPVCFVGHSHIPGIFYYDDGVVSLRPAKVKVDRDKRYVINIGSVGQPRDSDPRASYAIYDNEDDTVEIRRAAYDIKKAQGKILEAGLPKVLAYRLSEGR